jgi:CubicO group peptidase (beta-lactamase class C family)
MAGLLVMLAVPARAAVSPEDLVGLWGNETQMTQPVAGRLVLDLRGAPGEAHIGGITASVSQSGDGVRVALAGGLGTFRGHWSADRARVEGFWVQPPSALRSAYATPLTLTRSQPGVWMGTVQPQAERLSQYLKIEKGANGALRAFLRNPEANLTRERWMTVALEGDSVTFGDPGRPRWQLHASYDEETGQLQVNWQGIGVFAFTKRDRADAIGFYASTPQAGTSVWRAPLTLGDGWGTDAPAPSGFDTKQLDALLARVLQSDDAGTPQVQSLLIAHRGKLVVERYFHGFDADQPHDSRSAGKTFAPLLVGQAMAQSKAFTPSTPLRDMLPTYRDAFGSDSRKAGITVANLMTMTSGLACDDGDDKSPGNEDAMQSQHAQADWYRYTLALPMVREPGGDKAVYCSAGINLLGAVVAKATGAWLPDFFRRTVGDPLQMRDYHINLMPGGDAYLAGGIYLRPRDMLKLGQLYLDGGRWNGRRVVDAAWVKASTTEHSAFAPDHRYGYGWHLHTMTVGGHAYREYAAEGNGGQFVIVVPELELVVGIQAGNYGDFATWYKLQDLVPAFVIPALRRAR